MLIQWEPFTGLYALRMELKISISNSEIRRLVRKATSMGINKAHNVDRILSKGATNVERKAKRYAPVNKKKSDAAPGQLRSNIRKEGSAADYSVVAGAEYSIFQELGTGRRGAASGVQASVEGYTYGGGPKRPNSAGVPAQPFLHPAYLDERDNIIGDLIDELETI